jgi:hypothetical protein
MPWYHCTPLDADILPLVFTFFSSLLFIQPLYTLQNIPAPQSDRITTFQVSYPINHHFDGLVNFSFEYRLAELRTIAHICLSAMGYATSNETRGGC